MFLKPFTPAYSEYGTSALVKYKLTMEKIVK